MAGLFLVLRPLPTQPSRSARPAPTPCIQVRASSKSSGSTSSCPAWAFPSRCPYAGNQPLMFYDPYGLWKLRMMDGIGRTLQDVGHFFWGVGDGLSIFPAPAGPQSTAYRLGYTTGGAAGMAASAAAVLIGGGMADSSDTLTLVTAGMTAPVTIPVSALGQGIMGVGMAGVALCGPRAIEGTNAAMEASGTKGGGRASNNLEPAPTAEGPHPSFKTDPKTGKVINYETYKSSDPRNPSPWETEKRYDGNHPHFDKATGQRLQPHVHDPAVPSGVRSPSPDEIPR